MNSKYFMYALALTVVVTVINWFSLIGSAANSGYGSGRTGSSWGSSSGGYGGGGGHK